MGITIRPGTEADAERAGDIAAAAWEKIFNVYRESLGDEIFDALYTDWRQAKKNSVIKTFLNLNETIGAFIAEEDGETVGFVTYSTDGAKKKGEIMNNAVMPDKAGRGIGTMMYGRVLARFKERGMTTASVTTGLDAGHAPARRAYEKAGFNKHTESVTYYMKL